MTLKEAAARIGITPSRLRQLIKERRIQATLNPAPQGAYWTISEDECDRLLAARREVFAAKGRKTEANRKGLTDGDSSAQNVAPD